MSMRRPVELIPSEIFIPGGTIAVYLTYKEGSSPCVREIHAAIQTKEGLKETNRFDVSLDESVVVFDVLERLFKFAQAGQPGS